MSPRLHPSFFARPLAHRTLHDVTDGRAENSLAGAQAAVDHGYGIEIDLQLSSDGQAVVFHDDLLDRLTPADGAVRDRTLAELQATPLHGGGTIPSLVEFLDLIDGQVPLLIELKDQDGALGPAGGALEEDVCAALTGYDGPVGLMSFNPHSVARCAALAPDIPRGLVTEGFPAQLWPDVPEARLAELREIPDFQSVAASFISHHTADLETPRVAALRAAGADILCWTVRSAEQEAQARKVAHNITFEGYLP